jgi:hypothetical protein
MTRSAEQTIILKAAFSTAVSYGDDVIRFPARTRGSPRFSRSTIGDWRLGSCPLSVRLHDIQTAKLADALVTLPDLLTNVPGTAADFPLVNARVAAERASRGTDRSATPTTDWLSLVVSVRLAPLFSGHDTRAAGAHAFWYRLMVDSPLN